MSLFRRKRGFTLIELLVVIAIIGILASIIIVSLIGAQTKASDAKLETNASGIDTALEQYYLDTNNTYPASSNATNDITSVLAPTTGGGGITPYLASGASSSIFNFPNVGVGYVTGGGDNSNDVYLLATGLRSNSYTNVKSGNGIYSTSAAGNVTVNNLTVTGITGGLNNNPDQSNRAFAVYGPQ